MSTAATTTTTTTTTAPAKPTAPAEPTAPVTGRLSESGTREAAKEQAAAVKLDAEIRQTAGEVEKFVMILNSLLAQSKALNAWKLVTDADGQPFTTWRGYVVDVAAKNMPLMHRVHQKAVVMFLVDEGLTVREIEAATGISKSKAGRMLNSDESELGDESESGKAAAGTPKPRSSLADRAVKVLESVYSSAGNPDKISTHELARLQKELQRTLGEVGTQLKSRQTSRKAHPSGQTGGNPRTGAAAA